VGKIILARHGESEYGPEGRITGHSDPPLTENGVRQAVALSHFLKTNYHPIKAVFSSNLLRAKITAKICGGWGVEPEIIDGLMERNFGSLEGCPFSEIKKIATKYQEIRGKIWVFEAPGLESFPDLFNRGKETLGLLRKKLSQCGKNENILAVSHAGIMRMMCAAYLNKSWEEMFTMNVENCGVIVLEYF
jgi:probable phosphoglycerate mutase